MKKMIIAAAMSIVLLFTCVCVGVKAESVALTYDDALDIFKNARECMSHIQHPFDEFQHMYNVVKDMGADGSYTIREDNVRAFSTSTSGESYSKNGQWKKSYNYLDLDPECKYLTVDAWKEYAKQYYVDNIADEMTSFHHPREKRAVPIEIFRYDSDGILLKYYEGYGTQNDSFNPVTYHDFRDFRCNGEEASLIFTRTSGVTQLSNDYRVLFVKTDSGWKIGECSFVAWALGDSATSPMTGDEKGERAVMFAAGAVVAAAVPAAILTLTRKRRKDKERD